MNLLIVSPGRRVEIVEEFKKELNIHDRKVFTLDMSSLAPALYVGDEYFVINKDFNNLKAYVDDVIKLCIEHNISWVLTLIDPELKLFKDYEELFNQKGIKLIISDKVFIDNTIDKYMFYKTYKNILPLVDTFTTCEDVKKFYENKIPFPLMAKDRSGSASIGLKVIKSEKELKEFCQENTDYIIQKYIDNIEYGIDVYFDLYSHKMVDVFIKKKISMRAGETDKSISIWSNEVFNHIKKLEEINGIIGPIDVDVFIDKKTEKIYINEINPRFGGGYFHAHNSGCNYIKYTVNNIIGLSCENKLIPTYPENITMLKYNSFFFKSNL